MKLLLTTLLAGVGLALAAPAQAQININIGTPAPQYVVVREAHHPKKCKPRHYARPVMVVPAAPVYYARPAVYYGRPAYYRGGHGRGHGHGRH